MTNDEDVCGTNSTYTAQTACKSGKRLTRQRLGQLLINLYCERNTWRKYGKLKVSCNETHIIAPVKIWWWMTEIFLLITISVFVFEFFYHNWIVIIPAIIIAFLQVMAFYKTCLRDPGVFPRPEFTTAFRNLLELIGTWERGKGLALTRTITHPSGISETLQYCFKCHHFRPLTTNHCRTCDCCMLQQDHHCPVYGGCVAKKNLRAFHVMVSTMGGFWIYILGFLIYNLIAIPSHIKEQAKAHELEGVTITFYLVLFEIVAVIIITPIADWTKKICCKKPPEIEDSFKLEPALKQMQELLRFARENNLSEEEEEIISELLDTESYISEEETTALKPKSNDVNRNNMFYI